MEAVAILLNTLVSRILLGEFMMWLIFLFIGLVFMPHELVAYLNPKTPAYFPDGFGLADLAPYIFSFVAFIVWYLLKLLAKSLFQKAQQHLAQRRVLNTLNSLNDAEMQIVYQLTNNHFDSVEFEASPEIIMLIAKGVIQKVAAQSGSFAPYKLTRPFKAVFLSEFHHADE